MAHSFNQVFTYAYIDADASTPYETIVYRDVEMQVTIDLDQIKKGMRFDAIYIDIQDGQMRFYVTAESIPIVREILWGV